VIDSKTIESLHEILDEEIFAYRELLKSMDAHLNSLRGQDPIEIGIALQSNLKNVEVSKEIGLKRLEFTKVLLKASDIRVDSGLEGLLLRLSDATSGPLREKLDGISRLGRDIRFINDRNRSLAEHGMDLLRGDFRVLAELASDTSDQPGEDRTRGNLLSMRV
jgi:hypothetical protein